MSQMYYVGPMEEWTRCLVPSIAGLAPLMCFLSKCLVCWCSNDSEFTALGIDMGFLVLAGCNSFTLSRLDTGTADLARENLLEQLFLHIVLECVFYGFVHSLINRKCAQSMGRDMWAHHMASAVAGIYCRVAGKHLWTLALRLCMTEMTIALPIAFKHALRAKLLHGARSATISALMLFAYCWRMVWSGQVLRDYVVLMRRMDAQGTQQDGIWVVGAAALATVFCCNCFWFYKVCLGVVKHMGGKKRKAT